MECVGFMLQGVFLFNIVVFLLVKDFVFTDVCFEYQNSTGNGSWGKVLNTVMFKVAAIKLVLDAQKLPLYIMLKRRLPGFVAIIPA